MSNYKRVPRKVEQYKPAELVMKWGDDWKLFAPLCCVTSLFERGHDTRDYYHMRAMEKGEMSRV